MNDTLREMSFDRLMAKQGPGRREYWLLANEIGTGMPPVMVPDIILVPLCITEHSSEEKGAVFTISSLKRSTYPAASIPRS